MAAPDRELTPERNRDGASRGAGVRAVSAASGRRSQHGVAGARPEVASTLQLTPEQRTAIAPNRFSVALSAGAGCGKTFVLTRRFVAHLEAAAPAGGAGSWGSGATRKPQGDSAADAADLLARAVAITFTERAAREMRDRCRELCREKTVCCPAHQTAYWMSVLRSLETARISTIHSFCTGLLRAHATELGIDPRFGVLEEDLAAGFLDTAIAEALHQRLARRDADGRELVLRYGLAGTRRKLAALVQQRSRIDFDAWESLAPADVVVRWRVFRDECVVPLLVRQLADSPEVRRLLHLLREHKPSHHLMIRRRKRLLELLPGLATAREPLALLSEICEHARVQGGGGPGAWASPEVYEDIKNLFAHLRKQAGAIAAYAEPFDERAATGAAECGLRLMRLARHAVAHCEAAKREASVLDFDDLITKARDLLRDNRAVRERTAAGIDLLLVDEFQDTDPLQVEIVRLLCGQRLTRGMLFLVGDYKQSIYRFRGADPDVFARLRADLPAEGHLPLTRNFRSQPAILDFANALFADAFSAGGEARGPASPRLSSLLSAPPPYERLVPHREQLSPRPAVEFLWAVSETGEKENAPDSRAREARWIARRLRRLFESDEPRIPEHDPASGAHRVRPVRPGDVAVLLRALPDVHLYEHALRDEGIDHYVVGGFAFYAQQEILDLANLLSAVEDRDDAVALVGALRSPFFCVSDEALAILAAARGGIVRSLYDEALPSDLPPDQVPLVHRAAEVLSGLRQVKDRLGVADLVRRALALTGYDASLLGEFLGPRKLANLQKLVDLARESDASGLFTLADFIAQLRDCVVRQPKEPLAPTNPERADVVRLMTIHQAKGLEFPVVVVADAGRPAGNSYLPACFDPSLGPLTSLPLMEGQHDDNPGLQYRNLVERELDEAEAIRLFYVACTRAADHLIISAGGESLEKLERQGPWMRLLAERFELATGRCLARLPQGWPEPAIAVTRAEPEPVGTAKRIPAGPRRLSAVVAELDRTTPPPCPPLQGGRVEVPPARTPSCPGAQRRVGCKGDISGDDSTRLAGELAAAIDPIPLSLVGRRQFTVSDLESTVGVIAATRDASALHWKRAGTACRPSPSGQRELVFEVAAPMAAEEPDRNLLRGIDPEEAPVPLTDLASGTLRGTLTHAVLEQLDFRDPGDVELVVRRCLNRWPASAPLSAEISAMVERFLQTDTARELAAARRVYRELEFYVRWPPEGDGPVRHYLRGFIDCLFEDAGGRRHVIDYKSDRLTPDEARNAAGHYALQLGVYALAAERALGDPIQTARACFLEPGVECELRLTAELRAEIVHRASEAIAAATGVPAQRSSGVEVVMPRGGTRKP